MELTPATFHMRVIAFTKDAVYLRLPSELQRPTSGCSCDHCKKDPNLAKWDTLVVPTRESRQWNANFSYTVHMPDGSIAGFLAHCAREGKL
jgi:glutaredoxin